MLVGLELDDMLPSNVTPSDLPAIMFRETYADNAADQESWEQNHESWCY